MKHAKPRLWQREGADATWLREATLPKRRTSESARVILAGARTGENWGWTVVLKEHIQILVLSSKGHKRHSETLVERRGTVPFPGQKVQIGDTGEVFVVLRVDRDRRVADLLRHRAVHSVETGIPLALLTIVQKHERADEMEISA